MRIRRDDDHDVRELMERGTSSWTGPSPLAGQSRWAAEAARHHRARAAGLVVAGVGLAMIAGGSATLVAASHSPNGPAASVVRLVSHVFSGPPGGPPPAPLEPVPAPAPPSGSPAATASPAHAAPAPARSTPRPSPSPTRWADDGRRPSPSPSASAPPSPSPSRPPDE